MKKIILILLLISTGVFADGTNRPDKLAQDSNKRDESSWRMFDKGLGLQELLPEHLSIMPFAWRSLPGMRVKPTGPNYWIYFDRFPCRGEYARVWDGTGYCDDDYSFKEIETNKTTPQNIPEPSILLMILLGIIFYRRG